MSDSMFVRIRSNNCSVLEQSSPMQVSQRRFTLIGVDLRIVQEMMGHRAQVMTLRYAHLSAGHQLDAVQRLATKPTGTVTGTAANVTEPSTKPPKGIEPSTCRLRKALCAL